MIKISSLKQKVSDFKYAFKNEVSTSEKMSTKEIVSFGIVEGGNSCITSLKNSYYNLFLATCLGIKATDIATLTLVITILGYIKGPITSVIVDNTSTKWGRFKPYVVITLPTIMILTFAFFLNPFVQADQYTQRLVYLYVVDIAYNIIGGFTSWGYFTLCITRDEKEKSKFLSWGKIISTPLCVLPGVMPILIDLFGSQISLRYLFIIVSIVLFPISILAVLQAKNIQERVILPKEKSGFSNAKEFWTNIKLVFKNKYVMISWLGKVGDMFNYVADIACAYVFIYCYGMYSWLTVVAICGAIAQWLVLFFFRNLIDKIGAKWVVVLYKAMTSISMVVLFFVGYGTTPLLMLVPCICRFFGASLEFLEPIADTMFMTDLWDHYEWKYGVRNEATTDQIKGWITMPISIFQPILYALVFNKIGFVEGENVVQSQSTIDGLFFVYTIFIAIGFALDIIPFLLINIDKKTIERARKELKERKDAKERQDKGIATDADIEVINQSNLAIAGNIAGNSSKSIFSSIKLVKSYHNGTKLLLNNGKEGNGLRLFKNKTDTLYLVDKNNKVKRYKKK